MYFGNQKVDTKRNKKHKQFWINGDFNKTVSHYFPSEVSQNLFKNCPNLRISTEEIKTFIRIQREVVKTWLTRFGTKTRRGGSLSVSISSILCHCVADDIRYDGMNHFMILVP